MEREGDVSEINQQNYHGENGSHHHIDIPMNGNGNGNDNHNHNHNQTKPIIPMVVILGILIYQFQNIKNQDPIRLEVLLNQWLMFKGSESYY